LISRSAIDVTNENNPNRTGVVGAAAFPAFKSVIGTSEKSGGDVLEKLIKLIASATSQAIAPANAPETGR
jgi:hypothetical protein